MNTPTRTMITLDARTGHPASLECSRISEPEELRVFDTSGEVIASIDRSRKVTISRKYRSNPKLAVEEILTALSIGFGHTSRKD